jgi:hypothetical protein
MKRTYRLAYAAILLSVAVACDDRAPRGPESARSTQFDRGAEPDVASMRVAEQTGSKIGVPVDVLYSVAAAAAPNQPTSLDVAVVPRLEGSNLQVVFLPSDSVSIDGGGELAVPRAAAKSVHRQQLTVTPKRAASGSFRVQVIMDVAGGRYAGVFTIPVDAAQPR